MVIVMNPSALRPNAFWKTVESWPDRVGMVDRNVSVGVCIYA